MKIFKPGRRSAFTQITVFLLLLLAVQCALFMGFLIFGGTIDQMRTDAINSLWQHTEQRKNYIQNRMIQHWSDFYLVQKRMNDSIEGYLQRNQMSTQDLQVNDEKTNYLLEKISPYIIEMTRQNKVTGAFVVFTDVTQTNQNTEGGLKECKPGVYIRDLNPDQNPEDFSDLLVKYGPSQMIKQLNITADEGWQPCFQASWLNSLFYNPQEMSAQSAFSNLRDMGYWTPLIKGGSDGQDICVVYTQPLVDSTGHTYGLVGVEITVDYIRTLLPSNELRSTQKGSYLLATHVPENPEGEYQIVALNGTQMQESFQVGSIVHLSQAMVEGAEDFYFVSTVNGESVQDVYYASVHPLEIYSTDSPFTQEQWVLLGVMEQDSLFSFANQTIQSLGVIASVTLLVGTLICALSGRRFSRPLRRLARQVRGMDPSKPVALSHTGIAEVDDLADAVELLSRNVAESAGRISRIIRTADLSLAVFRVSCNGPHQVDYTENMFQLFEQPTPDQPLTLSQFKSFWESIQPLAEEQGENSIVYHLHPGQPRERWLRCKISRRGQDVLGVVLDITESRLKQRRIEYERDYDALTDLLNRRAFQNRLQQLQDNPDLGIAAMVMMDLDNLKYVNDTFGHDYGDAYIQCMGQVLRCFSGPNTLCGRISGDEFYVFAYGYKTQEELAQRLNQLQKAIQQASITLPDHQSYRLRASAGVAWYPRDAENLKELQRYADFAMYQIKHGTKGTCGGFDRQAYNRTATVIYNSGELNRILEQKALEYAFQPIVSCTDGSVLAYEALMRPRSNVLANPMDFIQAARLQSKLFEVDILTWKLASQSFFEQSPQGETLLFINSIPNWAVTSEVDQAYRKQFGHQLHRIVMELTEGDELDNDITQKKKQAAVDAGIRIALDDFGSGYSTDAVLLKTKPDFVKLDMSLIRDIDQDNHKFTLVRNLVELCHSMGSKVVAEGVETEGELRTLMTLQADYVQGYLLGRPAFQLSQPSQDLQQRIQVWNEQLQTYGSL